MRHALRARACWAVFWNMLCLNHSLAESGKPVMLAAPVPDYDAARVAALHASCLLFTPDDVALDRITAMARRHFQTSIALISLVDAQQQWFKSCIGLPIRVKSRLIINALFE